jgi:hypothetical protein
MKKKIKVLEEVFKNEKINDHVVMFNSCNGPVVLGTLCRWL